MNEEEAWLSEHKDVYNAGQKIEQPATVSVDEMQMALANMSYELDTRKFAFQGALSIAPEGAGVEQVVRVAKLIEAYLKEG